MLEFGSGDLIQPGETAYHLDLTAPELKLTYTALKALHDDLGHDEHDVRQVVADVLAKLPDEHVVRAINVTRELEALRRRDTGG